MYSQHSAYSRLIEPAVYRLVRGASLRQRVSEFTNDPNCLVRVQPAQLDSEFVLADGTCLPPGEPLRADMRLEPTAAERDNGHLVAHVDSHVAGPDLKNRNLANVGNHSRHEILVLIDSPTVGLGYLTGMVAELQRAGFGAVTCLFCRIAESNLWSRLRATSVNMHFLPSVTGGLTLGLVRPGSRSTIALILGRIGDFDAFADQLWDNCSIGDAIRGASYMVAVAPFAVGHVQTETTARQLAKKHERLARTIKSVDPLGHARNVTTNPAARRSSSVAQAGAARTRAGQRQRSAPRTRQLCLSARRCCWRRGKIMAWSIPSGQK